MQSAVDNDPEFDTLQAGANEGEDEPQGPPPNRAAKRAGMKEFRRMIRRPVACTQTFHPLLETVTPCGANKIRKRRAGNKRARIARRVNRRVE